MNRLNPENSSGTLGLFVMTTTAGQFPDCLHNFIIVHQHQYPQVAIEIVAMARIDAA